MTKKPRNKKYNKTKELRLVVEAELSNLVIAAIADDEVSEPTVKVTNLKGDELKVSTAVAMAASNFSYKWDITLAVGCYDSKGYKEIKFDYVPLLTPIKQRDLNAYLNERHTDFINDLRNKNVRIHFVGWTARANGRGLTDNEIDVIFDKLNAWD